MDQVIYDGHTTVYTYDLNGNRTTVKYGDGVSEVYSYDRNNRILNLINKRKDGSEVSRYRYTYDVAGRQETKSDSYGTTTYKYDQTGRIMQIEAPGKTTVYAYDRAGNRKSILENYTSMQPSSFKSSTTQQAIEFKLKKAEYLYSSSNQLLKLEERMNGSDGKEVLLKTVDYLYDAGGNEISQRTSYIQPHSAELHQSTGGETYGAGELKETSRFIEKVTRTYDGFNRLKKAVTVKSGDRSEIEFMYNGDGLRTQKTLRSAKTPDIAKETNYVYDRQHVILEFDGSGKLSTRYIRGINYIARMDQAEKYSYYLYNGHGDVVQTVTASGEVQNQYDYDVFGNRTLTIELYAESIQYAGEFYDAESGLYYLRARYYDPYTARFISEDSYRGEDTNPLSLNLYTYAHNNPILFLDPTGHWVEKDEKLNAEAQAKIIALTNAYYKADTAAEKKAISGLAEGIRKDPKSMNPVDTPLNIQAAALTQIVVKGTSKGYADVKEWNIALNKVGIQTPTPTTTSNDKTQGSVVTTTSRSQAVVIIGRTELTVNSNSTQSYDKQKKEIVKNIGNATLDMNYKVTKNEYLFIYDMGLENVEKSLYILDRMKANNGKATREILNDKTLSIKNIEMMYTLDVMQGIGLREAERLYEQEVVGPKRAEAWGLLGIKLLSSGNFSLQKKSIKGEPVEVEIPTKLKTSQKNGAVSVEGTGNVPLALPKGKVGNFTNVSNMRDFLSRIPEDAIKKPWNTGKGAQQGIKYEWIDGSGNKWNVRTHEMDPLAPSGSHASQGWIYRVEVRWGGQGKTYYMDSKGNFHPENVMKPNSPMYNEKIANDTHIKLPTGGGNIGN